MLGLISRFVWKNMWTRLFYTKMVVFWKCKSSRGLRPTGFLCWCLNAVLLFFLTFQNREKGREKSGPVIQWKAFQWACPLRTLSCSTPTFHLWGAFTHHHHHPSLSRVVMHQLLMASGVNGIANGGGVAASVPSSSSSSAGAVAGVVSNSAVVGGSPKELSDHDDIATAAIVDPYLEFKTHKMNLRFRGPKASTQRVLRKIVTDFIQHQNYEKAFAELFSSCDWLSSQVNRKSKAWQAALREHVNNINSDLFQ